MLVLLAALPLLFLHVEFQPTLTLGSTTIALSDLAVLAVAAAAWPVLRREGLGTLRRGLPVWIASAIWLALIFLGTLYGLARFDAYPFGSHLVTALKYAEYALLAPAAALLVRTARDLRAVLVVVAAWSVAALLWALAQFSGLITAFGLEPVLQRVPSFLGFEDFALLGAAAVAGALVTRGALAWTLAVAGAADLVLSGALAGVLGLWLGGAGVALVLLRERRLTLPRAAAIAAALAVTLAGALTMRSGDINSFFRFLGAEPRKTADEGDVQSYDQRVVLGYIGLEIFLDEPLLGVGWQGSKDEYGYGPQLAEAQQRFPREPELTFPSPEHPWGVHNAYVQALSDLGAPGLLALLGLLATAALVAARRGATLALAWLLVCAGISNGRGLVAGVPLDALLWLSVGLAAAEARDAN